MSTAGKPQVELAPRTTADAPLVERWLHADHVRRFWGEPEKIAAELDTLPPESNTALIRADGRKVGLVVWQHLAREELDDSGLQDLSTRAVDIDVMVGEPDFTGRGVATAAIRIVVERVLTDETVPYLMAATRLDNHASRRAFAKAGFREEREYDDPEQGRSVVMILRRDSEVQGTIG